MNTGKLETLRKIWNKIPLRHGTKQYIKRMLRFVVLSRRDNRRPPHHQYWAVHKNFMKSYKSNEKEIKMGNVPARYNRIAGLIPGDVVLELGAGEGVLSLLIAQNKQKVYGIDINRHRHETAIQLREEWKKIGKKVDNVEFILGNIFDCDELIRKVDTVIAVRVLYHLQEDAERIIKEISGWVKYIVLVGNARKAEIYLNSDRNNIDHSLGKYLFLSTIDGMVSILNQNGYKINYIDDVGDPIVVGEKENEDKLVYD